jgi:hypothetical protein
MESQMKQTLLLLILLISEPCFAGEYSDCILENMKGVNNGFAAHQIKNACREKALPYVPAKCIEDIPNISSENKIGSYQEGGSDNRSLLERLANVGPVNTVNFACIEECLNASYWSKHFGDCKK